MRFLIILLLVLGLNADDYEHHNKHYSERHINKELSHLDLSKEQNTKIRRILKEFRFDLKEYRDLKEDVRTKREDLFIKDVLDDQELNKLNSALDEKSDEIENRLLKSIHSILNQKQRREFIYYFDDWEVE